MPFRGELITWAANHAKSAEALRDKLLRAAEADGQTPSGEFLRLLDAYRIDLYAVGGIQADLTAGQFQ